MFILIPRSPPLTGRVIIASERRAFMEGNGFCQVGGDGEEHVCVSAQT